MAQAYRRLRETDSRPRRVHRLEAKKQREIAYARRRRPRNRSGAGMRDEGGFLPGGDEFGQVRLTVRPFEVEERKGVQSFNHVGAATTTDPATSSTTTIATFNTPAEMPGVLKSFLLSGSDTGLAVHTILILVGGVNITGSLTNGGSPASLSSSPRVGSAPTPVPLFYSLPLNSTVTLSLLRVAGDPANYDWVAELHGWFYPRRGGR